MWRALLILACAPGCDLVFKVNVPGDAPASTHDEDQDGLFDDVDNCPTLPNPPLVAGGPQDDLDSDGLGDACDPHPDVTGDALLTVEYFDRAFGDFWLPDADSWTVSLDSVISPVPPGAGQELHSLQRQVLEARGATLEMGFEVLDLGPSNQGNQIEIVVDTPGEDARCQILETVRGDGASDLQLLTTAGMDLNLLVPEVAVGKTLVLKLTRDAPDDVCGTGAKQATLGNLDPNGTLVTAAVGLIDIQIRINYIAIYTVVN